MGNNKRAGFTIIETMLFLGISSLLIVLLIAGTGASINVQRYQDAAESFKSLLQQQYADISSVQNSRDNSWSCDNTATISNSSATKDNRGQSKCMLLGKYMRLEDDKISIYNVVAYQKTINSGSTNDIDSLKSNYILSVAKDNIDSSTMEWGTEISYPKTSAGAPYGKPQNPRKMAILFIRSPDSGQVYTFSSSDSSVPDVGSISSASLVAMLVAGDSIPGQGSRLICINSGGMFATDDRSIRLVQFAASSGAVVLQTNEMEKATGSDLQC